MAQSKTSRRQQQREATRARVAEMRAAQEKAEKRRRLIIVGAAVLSVVVVIAVIAVIALLPRGNDNTAGGKGTGGFDLTRTVTTVPAATLDKIGAGTVQAAPKPVKGAALSKDGKPTILYVGAEFCPYCASERWAMVVALSRFGTFEKLPTTHSSPDDVYPNTPTFSFHGAKYSSKYIDFVGKELSSNERQGNQYAPLDKLTKTEETEFSKLTGGQGTFPFVDFAGKYAVNGVQYDPKVIEGKSYEQIAKALKDPNSDIAKAINGSANTITAAICKTTGNQPANVCSSKAISKLAGQLDAGGQ